MQANSPNFDSLKHFNTNEEKKPDIKINFFMSAEVSIKCEIYFDHSSIESEACNNLFREILWQTIRRAIKNG